MCVGNIETKSESTVVASRNVAIRNELDLYVNVLHCRSFANVPARQKDIDIVIIRQNTEGEYAMLEHEVKENGQKYEKLLNWVLEEFKETLKSAFYKIPCIFLAF